jgi:hypothetical protein
MAERMARISPGDRAAAIGGLYSAQPGPDIDELPLAAQRSRIDWDIMSDVLGSVAAAPTGDRKAAAGLPPLGYDELRKPAVRICTFRD